MEEVTGSNPVWSTTIKYIMRIVNSEMNLIYHKNLDLDKKSWLKYFVLPDPPVIDEIKIGAFNSLPKTEVDRLIELKSVSGSVATWRFTWSSPVGTSEVTSSSRQIRRCSSFLPDIFVTCSFIVCLLFHNQRQS